MVLSDLEGHPNKFWKQLAILTKPSLTDWVAPILYHFARLMEAKSTAEIGYGGGYCSIAMAIHARDFGGQHHVIDNAKSQEQTVYTANRCYDTNMLFHCMDATRTNWTIPLDLLFVDILATHEGFVATLKNFAPTVVRDGLMVVHDYYCFPEIGRAVDKVLQDRWQLITIPFDGKPRLHGAKGKCGMAIARKL